MNPDGSSRATESRSYIRAVISRLDAALDVEGTSPEAALHTSLVLVVTLVVVVPVIAIVGDVSLLVLVPIAGLGYAAFAYLTDRLYAGLATAFFVLVVFEANVPVASAPAKGNLNLYLADPLAVALLVVILRQTDLGLGSLRSRAGTLAGAAVVGLAVFVLWSYLAAAVGNGPSRLAAAIFAVQQTRYLLVFVVSILVVARSTILVGLYPLLLSIAGNLGYAVAEALSGATFGLTYLGDGGGRTLGELVVGPWTVPTGLFAGAFVGSTRELVGLLLLLLPFLVFLCVYGSRRLTPAGLLFIAGAAFLVKFGETDAGWMSSVLVLVLAMVATVLVTAFASADSGRAVRGAVVSAYALGVSVVFHAARFVRMTGDGSARSDGAAGENGASGGTGGGAGEGAPPSGPTTDPPTVRDRIVDLFGRLPLVEVDNLGVRLVQYTAAVEIAVTYPLVGIGGYNFVLVSESYGLPRPMGIHNTFFSHLAATGVPGLLAYTASVLAVLGLAGRAVLDSSGRERAFWGCVVAGLVGFHAYSFWVVIYGWVGVTAGFWALSGIVVGSLGAGNSGSAASTPLTSD